MSFYFPVEFFIIEIRQCSPYTSVDDCQVFYAYRYLPNRGGYSVFIKDEKGECIPTVLFYTLNHMNNIE